MCDAIGFPVLELFRTAIGPVSDPGLKSGEARQLTIEEVRSLYASAVLPESVPDSG
jgi:16S rRNA U516 pseudouridylate synthase RsuA-like enzyme